MAENGGGTMNANEPAISGYDAVEYFRSMKAVPGEHEYQVEYEGKVWLFSSADNQKAFEGSPEQYMPQYGGSCSWAMAKGRRVDVDPECFAVLDGKLYLNFSKGIHKKWQRRMQKLIDTADTHWAAQNEKSR